MKKARAALGIGGMTVHSGIIHVIVEDAGASLLARQSVESARVARVMTHSSPLSLVPVAAADFEELLALRHEAMRESLERLGRFDEQRSRARFEDGFEPSFTRHIQVGERRVGFVAVKPDASGLLLDHLYVRPGEQGRGVGQAVLALIFAQADAERLSLRVGALRESAANRFYERHGFVRIGEGPWDIYYARRPASLDAHSRRPSTQTR